jgi:hypothetical protein
MIIVFNCVHIYVLIEIINSIVLGQHTLFLDFSLMLLQNIRRWSLTLDIWNLQHINWQNINHQMSIITPFNCLLGVIYL